jgi:hypothetical protein
LIAIDYSSVAEPGPRTAGNGPVIVVESNKPLVELVVELSYVKATLFVGATPGAFAVLYVSEVRRFILS